MPWRECSVMEERLRFVARLLDGEGMSDVCREFGISRKTGYKIFNRYKDDGLEALTRPLAAAGALRQSVARADRADDRGAKKDKPHWGARKIRELLVRRLAGDVRMPSKSTVHAVLDRHGLVSRARQRRRNKAEGTPLSQAGCQTICGAPTSRASSSSATASYCYPLTVTDQASRYVLVRSP